MEKHPLHLKNPELQKSPEVERAVKRQEQKQGQKVPNEPAVRLEAYINRLENIFLHSDENTRQRLVERYRAQIHDALIIKPENFPESYFELQKRVAREQGYGNVEITPEMREQMIATAREDQKYSLDAWIDYLTSADAMYPPWFKYYAWNQITKLSQFDKERGEFKKRTESTVAPFLDIYREPLAQIADRYERIKDDNKDAEARADFDKKFPSLYAELISKSLAASMENREETKGQWVKYEQNKDGEAEKLFASLQGKGTGWCTAGQSTAKTQIESGDFYVYYTNDIEGQPTQPRLAIRMNGKTKIGEVRGVLQGQNVEPIMQEVLDEKLADFGAEADVYRQKSADMKRLTGLEHQKGNGEEFTKEDLAFLYEIDHKIEGFGYEEEPDPRIEELKIGRDIKNDLVLATGYQAEEISLTQEEALSGSIKYHYGDLVLSSLTSAKGLTLPQTIGGYLFLNSLTSAEGLTLPQTIGGSLDLRDLTSAEGLTLPQTIDGDLNLFSLTSAEGLTLPQAIGGSLGLVGLTSAEGLTLPEGFTGILYYKALKESDVQILIKKYPKVKFKKIN